MGYRAVGCEATCRSQSTHERPGQVVGAFMRRAALGLWLAKLLVVHLGGVAALIRPRSIIVYFDVAAGLDL